MSGKEFTSTPDRIQLLELSSGGQLSLGEESHANYTQESISKYSDSYQKPRPSGGNSEVKESAVCEESYDMEVSSTKNFSNIQIQKVPEVLSRNKKMNSKSILLTMFCCVGDTSSVRTLKISYFVTTFLASSIVFVFLQELVFSKLSNGYSMTNIYNGYLLGPPSQIVFDMGALDTNLIRNGQIIRLFWSFWLHTGFIHLLINLSSQVILGIILETRWVIWRYLVLYFIGGLSGNLASAVLDPCSVSAGSSACFFSLLAGIIVLLLENWRNSRWQLLYILLVCLASLVGISLSFMSNTDNWAHIGGFVAGLLWSFATMESFPRKRKVKVCRSYSHLSKDSNDKSTKAENKKITVDKPSDVEVGGIRNVSNNFDSSKSESLENTSKNYSYVYQRFIPVNCVCSGGVQTVRIISLLLLLSILTIGFMFLLYEPVYTRFNLALGHLSFSGIQTCSCCNSPEGVFWCSSSPSWIRRCS